MLNKYNTHKMKLTSLKRKEETKEHFFVNNGSARQIGRKIEFQNKDEDNSANGLTILGKYKETFSSNKKNKLIINQKDKSINKRLLF